MVHLTQTLAVNTVGKKQQARRVDECEGDGETRVRCRPTQKPEKLHIITRDAMDGYFWFRGRVIILNQTTIFAFQRASRCCCAVFNPVFRFRSQKMFFFSFIFKNVNAQATQKQDAPRCCYQLFFFAWLIR